MAAHSEEEAIEKAAKKFNVPKKKIAVKQGFLNLSFSLKLKCFVLQD